MYNLGTVISFELTRALKKKSFWIMAFSFPIVIIAIFLIIFMSNKATSHVAETVKDQKFSIAITDTSHKVAPELIKKVGAQPTKNKAAAIEKVKDGKLDAYFYYPKDLTKQSVEIYAKDAGLFDNSRYESTADALLKGSVIATVSPDVVTVLTDTTHTKTTTYKDGEVYNGFMHIIAPGFFLILFYILITMFGNQMLTITTEEKENRVIEMVLTTIKPRTLIIGKILSIMLQAFIQMAVIVSTLAIAYFITRQYIDLGLPNVDLSSIPFDATRIIIGALVFFFSFMLFTGLLVAIGAATPTAKEAGSFFGMVMVFIFGPLYAVTLFVSSPKEPIVQFLSYFPLTAPIPLMLRNAVGNLTIGEASIGIAILVVSAVISLTLAIRMFRYGALSYSSRLKFSTIFRQKRP